MANLYDQLKNQIMKMPPGTCIAVTDFREIANLKTVSKMLSRLAKAGTVEKVMRGIFWLPDGKESFPAPGEVAAAIARENDWELAPSGDTALYLGGLSEKKPKIWTFVTTGKYKSYEVGGQVITFTHTTSSLWGSMSAKSRLFIQCLKAYGKGALSEDRRRALASKLKLNEFHTLKKEAKTCSAWISDTVSDMGDYFDQKQNMT